MTPGFSGAEIENLVNHAIIDGVDNNLELLKENNFEEARDRVLTGIKLNIPKETIKNILQTAVHESGHILTCLLDDICKEDIHKVSIVNRGASKSKTYSLSNDNTQGTKEEMISWLDVSLGGRFAEEIYYNDENKISTGCENGDLQKATKLAKSMIKTYGMTKSQFGLQVIDDSSHIVSHKISESTRDKIDSVTVDLINTRSKIIKKKLIENSELLKVIIKNLISYEELTKSDLEELMKGKILTNKPLKNQEVIKLFEQKKL